MAMAFLPGKYQKTNSKASSRDGWERVCFIGLTQGPEHCDERSKGRLSFDTSVFS